MYEKLPDFVDWIASEKLSHDVKSEIAEFDLSHIIQACQMQADGRLKGPVYVQFVLGVKNAIPADERVFDFYIETLAQYAPDAQCCAAEIGKAQAFVNEWAIRKGGHTRTGLEDNVRLDRTTLAPSKAALFERAVRLCHEHDQPVASWREARQILGLPLPPLAGWGRRFRYRQICSPGRERPGPRASLRRLADTQKREAKMTAPFSKLGPSIQPRCLPYPPRAINLRCSAPK